MILSKYRTLLLLPVAVCALVIALCGQVRSQPAKPDQKPEKLKEWEFPDAEGHRSSNLKTTYAGNIFASDYATSKPLEEVWTYYAKKIGYEKEYSPNMSFAGGVTTPRGDYGIMILNSSDKPSTARVRRTTTKSATLIRRGPGGNVTIFISRAKDEDKTYFTLIVEGK